MSREVRRVPADWVHPKENGQFKPLLDHYQTAHDDFMGEVEKNGLQAAIDYYGCAPDINDYMPDWPDEERTHLMMYESTSEGTPLSPAFATPEELARWLADNNASAFGSMTATYEQWLSTCRQGWAISAVMVDGVMTSGVADNGRERTG